MQGQELGAGRVSGSGMRVYGLGYWVRGLEFRIYGKGLQGYLAHKKTLFPRTLQLAYA